MRVRHLLIIVAGLLAGLVSPPARAGESHTENAPVAANSKEADSPSLDLIEYLGSWETHDGKWIDPADLEEMMKKKKEEEKDETR